MLIVCSSHQAKGEAQHAKGTGELEAARAKQSAEAAGDGLKGNLQKAGGALTGDHELKAKGDANKAHGDVKGKTNF